MLTVNASIYKDVTCADFNHYFGETVMAWKLSPTKRRLFIVNSTDGDGISGTYLTRESKFNNKKIAFAKWWESLDPIVLQPLIFNIGGGCAVWRHQLAKNLKKSFPWKSNNIKFYGIVTAKDKLLQNVASIAFGELYARDKVYPGLLETFLANKTAATKEGFILDPSNGRILYRDIIIGTLGGGKINLNHTCGVFALKLGKAGLNPNNWTVLEAPPKPAIDKLDNQFMDGYCPLGIDQGIPGYAISNGLGTIRTYNGAKWPAPIPLGWGLYNTWNQA